jgi:pimeloyl-ACP methyl ester carboxylesterase
MAIRAAHANLAGEAGRRSRLKAIVLLNPVGIDTGSPEKTIVDPMKLAPAERAAFAFHDPARFALVPPNPEALAMMVANQKTLRVYGGELMHDPALRPRLAQVNVPTLIVWGASDRIVDADYGRLFAASIPGSRFELVPEAGHFPHIERRDAVVRLIADFANG